jgi:hypothetical protein
LKTAFLEEARRNYEEDSSTCITNVQGLWVLSKIAFADGLNRAGSAYRYRALKMLSELKLPARYKQLSERTDEDLREMRVIAKICWGMFASGRFVMSSCTESMSDRSAACFRTR